jgi:hypothetical protein
MLWEKSMPKRVAGDSRREPTRGRQVAACLKNAADCEVRAMKAKDQGTKNLLLDLARRWRRIDENYKYIEQVERFLSRRNQ